MCWAARDSSRPARRSPWPASASAPRRSGKSAVSSPARTFRSSPCATSRRTASITWNGARTRSATASGGSSSNPTWREGFNHVPGGRDVGKEVVETYYAKQRGKEHYKGCATYVDFRELLEKEKDVTAVKVMTPDHTHATISIAALKKGMNVIVHKPLANRLLEARAVIDTARSQKVATHFMPASTGAGQKQAVDMIKNGAIGTLREIHNWSMRPDVAAVPDAAGRQTSCPRGFRLDALARPALDRPYHPNYTHTNFRGWYEFGGGSIADMGHYSLWPIFQLLDLDSPISVESTPSHVCTVSDEMCHADQERLLVPGRLYDSHAVRGQRRAGRPSTSSGTTAASNRPCPRSSWRRTRNCAEEGMMFVGDKGKILGGFRSENPQLIPEAKMRAYRTANHLPEPAPRQRGGGGGGRGATRRRAMPPGSLPSKEARPATVISCSHARSATP